MIANYGYKDGSGDYFIAIDTDNLNKCRYLAWILFAPTAIDTAKESIDNPTAKIINSIIFI